MHNQHPDQQPQKAALHYRNPVMTMPEKPILRVVVVLLVLPFLMLACTASNIESNEPRQPTDAEVEQYNASVLPEERIICRKEIPVGTNIPKRLCRLVKDVEETSQFHREQLRRVLF